MNGPGPRPQHKLHPFIDAEPIHKHPTVRQLWINVLLYPQDVDRRLVYAEALEEYCSEHTTWWIPLGENRDAVGGCGDFSSALGQYQDSVMRRAEFIRLQVELGKAGPPRKQYRQVDNFSFFKRRGACYIEGRQLPVVGERIDLHLPDKERKHDDVELANRPKRTEPVFTLERDSLYKPRWPGVYVERVSQTERRVTRNGLKRCYIEFRVDKDSQPWQWQPQHNRAVELFITFDMTRASGLDGTHQLSKYYTLQYEFTFEVWVLSPTDIRLIWRNGFPDTVECTASAWSQHGPNMVRRNPISSVLEYGSDVRPDRENCLPWARQMASLERYCQLCRGNGYIETGDIVRTVTETCPTCKGRQWEVNEQWGQE